MIKLCMKLADIFISNLASLVLFIFRFFLPFQKSDRLFDVVATEY